MSDRLVKIGEAAKILGVNPQTLRCWEDDGVIKPSHKSKKLAEDIETIVSEEKAELELQFGSQSNPTDRTESE